jgi:hypothetical protein
MSAQHTPGPWIVDGASETVSGFDSYGERQIVVYELGTNPADHALLGTAPELLEALRRLEVSANTVAYCYEKRPENFAAALVDLADNAAAARAAIAQASPSTTADAGVAG